MPSLSDCIEKYLQELLDQTLEGALEIGRNRLAEQFRCAPSQINYVLEKRFTLERGYLVESRRGGGGYVRLVRLGAGPGEGLSDLVLRQVGQEIDQRRAEHVVLRLLEAGTVTPREARLMRAACRREVLGVDLPRRDALRARLLKAMVLALADRGGDAP
ncbi:MAG: CtsR family transcriptional regulator [Acetobacteraceae bacterium]|nr:CtsR family transcriptional regulator [Acetobacteraceae bacterium]